MAQQARFRRLWAGFLFLFGGLMLAGCGGRSLGTVSGKVSYKGQPLKGGTVAIIPNAAGGIFQGSIQEDGSYKIEKVPTGPATITVETASLRPSGKSAMPGPYSKMPKELLRGAAVAEATGDPKRYVPIPERYANHADSGLSLNVKSGPQTHNIDLN